MEDLSQTKDQMKALLTLVENKDNLNIETDIYLQIYSIKETERDSKKVYMMSLCDQDYKFNSFFLASNENIPELKEGKIIHIKEVSPRKIKNSKFIRIKEFELLGEPLKINEVKEMLRESGRDAVMVENCGMPDEKRYNGVDCIPDTAGYFALIIAK